MNVFSQALSDTLASLIGSPPAYLLTPARPPSLGLRQAKSSPPSSSSPSLNNLKVTQFTPAYDLQLYLRLTSTSHVVVNTPYHRFNNGAFPTLSTDNLVVPSEILGGGGGGSYAKESATTEFDSDSVSIFSLPLSEPLLHLQRLAPLHADGISPHSPSEEHLYCNLISVTLEPLLLALSFGDDGVGYKVTASRWSTPIPLLPFPFSAVSALYHVTDSLKLWAEKVSVLRSLVPSPVVPTRRKNGVGFLAGGSTVHLDVPASLRAASQAYSTLSSKLASSDPGPYLLGSVPSVVDCVLFGHLVEALSNPHLSALLPSHPPLLLYFVRLCESTRLHSAEGDNALANRDNARDCLPASYSHAKSSLARGDAGQGVDAGVLPTTEPAAKRTPPLATLHRLRFGGSFAPPSAVGGATAPESRGPSEAARAQNSADNQLWVGCVGVGALAFLLVSRINSK